eukprot:gene36013-59044_t
MRQQRRAGEKLFIDYAGPTLELADGSRPQVFVAAMGASSYTFACATADQSMRSWLGAMARALSFYGAVRLGFGDCHEAQCAAGAGLIVHHRPIELDAGDEEQAAHAVREQRGTS